MKKKANPNDFDESFYIVANNVKYRIAKNENIRFKGMKLNDVQKIQVEELISLEKQFRDTIAKRKFSNEIYKKFLQNVCIKNRNILSARPYFRETAKTFSKNITPAIRMDNIQELKKFNINFLFIKFIKANWLGVFPPEAEELYSKIFESRRILIENNMPLAINRAKLFFRKTPQSHLTLLDLIGICSLGLATGIDKWCGPYSPVFRSVCIGRMVGNMIEDYSETLLHFYPSDKRILYKANSIKGRRGIEEIDKLTTAVNNSLQEDIKEGKNVPISEVKVGELNDLMHAASTTSADMPIQSDKDREYNIYDFTADVSIDAEELYAIKESMSKMLLHVDKLPLIHRKILRLKGIKL